MLETTELDLSSLSKQEKASLGIIELHGKDYHSVARRVGLFRQREEYTGWSLKTKIVDAMTDENIITMKAIVKDGEGRTRAVGHAKEIKGATGVNSTSHIENCETSAIGRVLACLGLGGTEFASADEIAAALIQQKEQEEVGETEYQKAEKEFYELVKYNEQTGELKGTIIDVQKAIETISAKHPPNVVKNMSMTFEHFEESLAEIDAV
jgi:hypothetical protein